MLDAYKRGKASVWKLGATALTAAQLQDRSDLVESWRKENPDQYYVSHVRFEQFAAYRRVTRDSKSVKAPGSILRFLYIDPLSNLEPVVRELHSYRELTERMLYLFVRMPTILSWQFELSVAQTATAPEAERALASVEAFANATNRFADAAVTYPEDLSQIFRDTLTHR
jgi:hypothetical protein